MTDSLEGKRAHPRPLEKSGLRYWTEEIRKAGYLDQLRHFNDVLVGRGDPPDLGDPVLRDIKLDGMICDVYHTDKKRDDHGHRIFVHLKS